MKEMFLLTTLYKVGITRVEADKETDHYLFKDGRKVRRHSDGVRFFYGFEDAKEGAINHLDSKIDMLQQALSEHESMLNTIRRLNEEDVELIDGLY